MFEALRTYVIIAIAIYYIVYAFFNSFLSSQCLSLYHIYHILLHMSVLPSLYPSLCVYILHAP